MYVVLYIGSYLDLIFYDHRFSLYYKQIMFVVNTLPKVIDNQKD